MFPTATLIPFGPEFTVSTLTTLKDSLTIEPYPEVQITLRNPDLAEDVYLFADPGSGGVFDVNSRQQAVAAPGGAAVLKITRSMWQAIRISAQATGPGYPSVAGVTFEVRARRRGEDPF